MTERRGLPCLFCDDGATPKTDEHLMQRALGVELRLKDEVCASCNTGVFAPEDKRFVDLIKGLICYPQSGFAGVPLIHGRLGLSFDPQVGVWTTVRRRDDGLWAVVPQIVRLPDGSWTSLVSEPGEAARMFAELAAGGDQLEIQHDVVPDREPPHQLSVLRAAPRKFVVRASDASSAATLAGEIREARFAPFAKSSSVAQRVDRDPVHIQAELPLGSWARSLAKNTVNFLCKVYGSEIARHPALRVLKDLARGKRPPLGDDLVTLPVPGRSRPVPLDVAVGSIGRHAMMLLPVARAGRLFVVTWLYRAYVGMVGVPEEVIPGDARMAALFIDEQGRPRILKMPEDVQWFGDFLEDVPPGD